jgi:hypothetical protein
VPLLPFAVRIGVARSPRGGRSSVVEVQRTLASLGVNRHPAAGAEPRERADLGRGTPSASRGLRAAGDGRRAAGPGWHRRTGPSLQRREP